MATGRTGMGGLVRVVVDRYRRIVAAPWTTDARRGLWLIVTGSVLILVVAACGQSAVALDLGPRTSFLPPWYLPRGWITLDEWVAVPMLWLALSLGTAGLWICWRALRVGVPTTASSSGWAR